MEIEESLFINADLNKVWKTFTDLTCWKDWNTVMRNVCSDEKCIAQGSEVRCNFRPFLFPVKAEIKVEEVIPYERIIWSAKKRDSQHGIGFLFKNMRKEYWLQAENRLLDSLSRVLVFFFL